MSFDEGGVQFGWDATSISSYEKCPRYYHYKHIEGWQPDNKSPHLLFGGWYATALEHYYKHLAKGMPEEEALIAVVREALIATWEYETDPVSGECLPGTGQPWNSLHNTKTRETLLRTIVWYIDHFEEDPTDTVILDNGEAACELSFSLPVTDGLVFCGHLDRLVEYSGGKYVMDQKTTGATITPRFFEGFSPDVQMSMYTWAGKIMFDLPVKGVIIDGAQIAVGFTRYERGFVNRSGPVLDEWFENSLWTIDRAREATAKNQFPMNRTACGNYGGCEFRKICTRLPEHRPNLLAGDFKRMPRWDPLKRR